MPKVGYFCQEKYIFLSDFVTFQPFKQTLHSIITIVIFYYYYYYCYYYEFIFCWHWNIYSAKKISKVNFKIWKNTLQQILSKKTKTKKKKTTATKKKEEEEEEKKQCDTNKTNSCKYKTKTLSSK